MLNIVRDLKINTVRPAREKPFTLAILPLQCLYKESQHFSGEVSAHFQNESPHTGNTLKEMIFLCEALGLTEGPESIQVCNPDKKLLQSQPKKPFYSYFIMIYLVGSVMPILHSVKHQTVELPKIISFTDEKHVFAHNTERHALAVIHLILKNGFLYKARA